MNSRPRVAAAALLTCSALGLAGALATSPAGAATATAVPAASAASGATSSVTLFLKAPNPGALARLAATPVTDRAARLAELATLVPSDADRASVLRTLSADGLTLVKQTSWSITAKAPASVITGLFGSRAASAAHAVATGPLPLVPSSLTSLVSAAYPTTGGPAAFHPMAATSTLTGTDFRNADTAAGVAPSTGAKSAGVTVATLQLANLPSGDLTTYAKNNGLADPVAAGAYKAVDVDGGPGPTDSLTGGAVEVDLDQESILSTAPSAHQQAYYAPNTQAGFNDVFSNVFDDVVGNSMATAPDPHLVALSSSWGSCEGVTGAANIATLEPILQSVVAAGVTIFGSSGDDGIYDCRSTNMTGTDNTQADVDYPASSPYVVSTGGSNLSSPVGGPSLPNTGSNWTEKTWSCTDSVSCETGTGGGGGGASGSANGKAEAGTTGDFAGFPMPAYQKKTLTGDYAKATTRLVPDIAADADPATGFVIYTSDPLSTIELLGNTGTVGGTSLASPISAAQLANTLGDAGRTSGVGDIHGALYSASVEAASLAATDPAQPLRDVTVGQIGADTDKGSDPSVMAGPGFDTTSGVGGVLWNAMAPYLFSTATPTVTATGTLGTGADDSATLPVTFDWTSVADPKDPILFDGTTVTVTESGVDKAVTSSTDDKGPLTIDGTRGRIYTVTVVGQDIAGHAATASSTVIVPTTGTTPPAAGDITPAPTPTLVGTKTVGHKLYGHIGDWDPKATLLYRWLRNGHVVKGANAPTYVLTKADLGRTIVLAVIGTETGFPTTVRTSAATPSIGLGTQIHKPVPRLTGTPRVGQRLTAIPGVHDAGTRIYYHWYIGTKVTHATGQSFRLTKAAQGQKVHAVVTSRKAGYLPVVKSTPSATVR